MYTNLYFGLLSDLCVRDMYQEYGREGVSECYDVTNHTQHQ